MASYLRPRRGKKATAVSQLTASAPLKRGEIFFEVPDTGVGTGIGKIKMGDGTTEYASLPYFLEQPTSVANATNASTANYAKNAGTAAYASNGAKATSATSATYSSTANYAKSSAGATTASKATSATSATYAATATSAGSASKATSATSATYSSTANYAKAVPSTVASRISTLETSFQAGCNTIMQAVTAKGVTPASNSPADISAAINAIPSIASGTLTGTMSSIAASISTKGVHSSDGAASTSQKLTLTAGKTYIILSIATGAVCSGYGTDYQHPSTYPNTNWRLTSVTLSTNSSNTIQNLANQASIAAGNGTISYRIDRITATVNQTITASASVSGHYKPSVAVAMCLIYAQ